jgi:hypothetical protein
MAKYLVVAHETVTNPMLLEQIRKVEAEDKSAEFTLLVPATPVRHLLFGHSSGQKAEEVAHELAEKARKAFEKNHLNLYDARVGSESPDVAIDEEVKAHPGYAGFIISTHTKEKSRWLALNLPTLVQSKYGLPVRHVEAPIDFFASEMP